jgi:biotin operon repressor
VITLVNRNCYICGKQKLDKNEIGLVKKLIGKNTEQFYCLECLAEYLEVTTDELLAKVDEFKEQGCTLF